MRRFLSKQSRWLKTVKAKIKGLKRRHSPGNRKQMSFPPLSYRRGNWHPDEGALASTSTKEDILAKVSTPGEIRPVWVADAHYTAVCGRACLSLWRSNESPAVRLRSDFAGQTQTDLEDDHSDLNCQYICHSVKAKPSTHKDFHVPVLGTCRWLHIRAAPSPWCNYMPKNWKRRTNPQASVSTQWDVLLIGNMHECISVHPWMSWLSSSSSSGDCDWAAINIVWGALIGTHHSAVLLLKKKTLHGTGFIVVCSIYLLEKQRLPFLKRKKNWNNGTNDEEGHDWTFTRRASQIISLFRPDS